MMDIVIITLGFFLFMGFLVWVGTGRVTELKTALDQLNSDNATLISNMLNDMILRADHEAEVQQLESVVASVGRKLSEAQAELERMADRVLKHATRANDNLLEANQLADALDKVLPAATWFHLGPYGSSPDIEDYHHACKVLKEYKGTKT